MKITQREGIDLLLTSLPYPEQIEYVNLKNENAIYFNWQRRKWKFDLSVCVVDMVEGSMLNGNTSAMLMTELIKRTIQLTNGSKIKS